MRVFVTGASGWVGSQVTKELLQRGHQVLGLARSEEAAAKIRSLGAEVLRGDVTDPESLRNGARSCDAVIHCGFIHDFSKFKESTEVDRRAIEAMGEALKGTQKPFVVTSGTAIAAASGKKTFESDVASNVHNPRIATEQAVDAVLKLGVRAMIVRLPPTTHGIGEHGFSTMLIALARDKKMAGYIGDGSNVWAAVHRDDAALVYVLAMENGKAGDRYHAVDEEGVSMRTIAETIGRHLNVPAVPVTDAADYFGWFQHFAALNNPTSSEWTRKTLGWHPTKPRLLEDLDHESYYVKT